MFDKSIQFKYAWRDYQSKVLSQAQQFVDDRHIHIVAAPGSGKTVLGLELMRRINAPTIILAPTLAIRNQWAERFTTLFMDNDTVDTLPDWLSMDVNKPAKLTIITYQGLYSALAGKRYKQQMDNEQAEEESEEETFLEPTEADELSESENEDENENIIVPAVSFNGTLDDNLEQVLPQPAHKPVTNLKADAYLKS